MANNPFLADLPHRHYLLEWRKSRGLTQAELGKRIDANGAAISHYEKDQRGLPLKIVYRLWDGLDILPGQLFAPPEVIDLNAMVRGASAKKRRRIVELIKLVMEEAD